MVLLSIPISEKRARLSASRPQEVHTTLRVAIRPHGGYIRETDPWMTYPSWAENALGVREALGAVEGLRVLRSGEAGGGKAEQRRGSYLRGRSGGEITVQRKRSPTSLLHVVGQEGKRRSGRDGPRAKPSSCCPTFARTAAPSLGLHSLAEGSTFSHLPTKQDFGNGVPTSLDPACTPSVLRPLSAPSPPPLLSTPLRGAKEPWDVAVLRIEWHPDALLWLDRYVLRSFCERYITAGARRDLGLRAAQGMNPWQGRFVSGLFRCMPGLLMPDPGR